MGRKLEDGIIIYYMIAAVRRWKNMIRPPRLGCLTPADMRSEPVIGTYHQAVVLCDPGVLASVTLTEPSCTHARRESARKTRGT